MDATAISRKPSIISAAALMAMNMPPQRWVIRGILPEGLTIIAGKPKLGKSWLALWLAIAVAKGSQALGRLTTDGGDVLCMLLEDGQRRAKTRLEIAIPDGDAPLRLHVADFWPRFDAGGLHELDMWLEAHKAARLVIIDTLARVRPSQRRNGNAYAEDYAAIQPIKDLAEKHHVAIIVVHHDRKLPSNDVFETVSGTQGLTGAADTLWVLKRERGQYDAVLHVAGRDVDEQELALRGDKDSYTWSLMGDAEQFRMSDQRKVILDAFATSPPISMKPITPRQLRRNLPPRRYPKVLGYRTWQVPMSLVTTCWS